ncbi:hypothetical protein D6C90_00095 [Aureobasidium pullulans]|uniref:Uncharacterized protein n=1 Tax=Aureobasidium pullulans TaxID=5580 RepID=A0A4S9VPT0_AURPU|nr:hypothetical protein D6C90_00095 [Aureobasidium pullulans]
MPEPGRDAEITDDYATELLKRDAKAVSSSSSLASLMNKSSRSTNAPKPNTRFLRNILRDTDNHNAALLAKEAQESKLRLDQLRHPHPHRPEQQLYSARDRHDPKRRRLDPARHRPSTSEKTSHRRHSPEPTSKKTSHRRHSPEPTSKKTSHRRHLPEPTSSHSQSSRRSTSPDRHSSDRHRSRRRSPSSNNHESVRHRRHSRRRSSSPDTRRPLVKPNKPSGDSSHRSKRRRSPSFDASDSDPLDAIIGPAPPSNPPVRSRGRGTHNNASTIDNHFSSNYDPSTDTQPHVQEDDGLDWDQALEALRDRQKWKQQGADRLRAAGFSEKHVTKWEKGGEKSEEDVVWAKKGEGREWDRGKVVDEHGVVELKPEWGRLKDS